MNNDRCQQTCLAHKRAGRFEPKFLCAKGIRSPRGKRETISRNPIGCTRGLIQHRSIRADERKDSSKQSVGDTCNYSIVHLDLYGTNSFTPWSNYRS
jgi:hypothetical protein